MIDESFDPMLIMEFMEHGSLYDLLHNETMVVEGEILLPILRDISQGMRFLHAADPQVIHGDLKAQNILVDKRFRAKVADFGLSQKKQIGGTGSIYWMAPELLRKESVNTSATDIFSFGGKFKALFIEDYILCMVLQNLTVCFMFQLFYMKSTPEKIRTKERMPPTCCAILSTRTFASV